MQIFLFIAVLIGFLAAGAQATVSLPPVCERHKSRLKQAEVFHQIFVTNMAAAREVMALVKIEGVSCLHRTIADADYAAWMSQPFRPASVDFARDMDGMLDEDICEIYRAFYRYQDEHILLMHDIFNRGARAVEHRAWTLDDICPCLGEEGDEVMALRESFLDDTFAANNEFNNPKAAFTDGGALDMMDAGNWSGGENDKAAGKFVLC